jgi:phosphatidylinositol-bisphosphatase
MESRVLYSIPREIWLLVDHLYRHGLKTRDLFESCALHEELTRIRDWLDYGSLDPLRILSFQHYQAFRVHN